MKFSTLFTVAAVLVAGVVSAAPERAHELKARVQAENGLEKRRGNGKMTWYGGGMLSAPACGGSAPSDSDHVVAVPADGNTGRCNQRVRFHYQGKTAEAVVRDYCDGCEYGHFDATRGLFQNFADLDAGVLTGVDYEFI
ncbi:hypothetical protein ACI68E_000282 [Malassezia pachydermatis]|uniref:RlpA-like protein double-psi beta-barrel domain-containing protein n=1 Tax=Malassezia pachydermatis TaxID=77020 RepID=A0A0M8MWB0_9BASI|nr:hypothetical protein Malapachy_2094 [Malassezia pachydermatis]KOS15594.1 hypothetical protein Malapachy_2094 [Malassezia pachydermatis]